MAAAPWCTTAAITAYRRLGGVQARVRELPQGTRRGACKLEARGDRKQDYNQMERDALSWF